MGVGRGEERQLVLDLHEEPAEGLLAAAGRTWLDRGAAAARETASWHGAELLACPEGREALRAGPGRKERTGLKSCTGRGW